MSPSDVSRSVWMAFRSGARVALVCAGASLVMAGCNTSSRHVGEQDPPAPPVVAPHVAEAPSSEVPAPAPAAPVAEADGAVDSSALQLAAVAVALEDARGAATEEPGADVLSWAARLDTLARTLRTAPPAAQAQFGEELRTVADALDRRRARFRRQIDPARLAHCGPEPELEAPEGELEAAEDYIKHIAHDASSVEVEDCSPPVLTDRACWLSTCEVRQDNEFGAGVFALYEFSIARTGVLEAHVARCPGRGPTTPPEEAGQAS